MQTLNPLVEKVFDVERRFLEVPFRLRIILCFFDKFEYKKFN
ncbi:hypothetical protein LEP1GSC041_1959 [Leptospira noguchii str. 2006001870]|nr:hypothetical protein LEP1GSC041_1959 [Leptospira noguchii str. 2006001870]